jgi:hypothetical protein
LFQLVLDLEVADGMRCNWMVAADPATKWLAMIGRPRVDWSAAAPTSRLHAARLPGTWEM